MRSRVTLRGLPSSPVTVSVTFQSFWGRPASRAVKLLSWWRCTLANHCSKSLSDTPASSVLMFSRAFGGGPLPSWTWRTVIGSIPGSAAVPSSTTPNGAAANLASGGIPPVAVCSGKADAFASVRPEASRKSLGSVSW